MKLLFINIYNFIIKMQSGYEMILNSKFDAGLVKDSKK